MIKKALIVNRGDLQVIDFDNILFIEKDGRRTAFHTLSGVHYTYTKLEDFSKDLGENFLTCHSSCIINMDKVTRFKGQLVTFSNGSQLAMGRENSVMARRSFIKRFQAKITV